MSLRATGEQSVGAKCICMLMCRAAYAVGDMHPIESVEKKGDWGIEPLHYTCGMRTSHGGSSVSEEQLSSYSHGKNTMIFNIFLPIVSRLYRVRFLSISFFFSFSLSPLSFLYFFLYLRPFSSSFSSRRAYDDKYVQNGESRTSIQRPVQRMDWGKEGRMDKRREGGKKKEVRER